MAVSDSEQQKGFFCVSQPVFYGAIGGVTLLFLIIFYFMFFSRGSGDNFNY